MNNRFIILSFIFFAASLSLAQNYFPTQPGYVWFFKNIPLDSLNNEIDSLSTYSVDSFAVTGTYQGQMANIVLTKTGPSSIINVLPYVDTNFVNITGNEGSIFFEVPGFDSLSVLIDSLGLDSVLAVGFINLFNSFKGWYPMYKFTASTSSNYQIFKYDTTITIDTVTLPMRFEVKGRRQNDEILSTQIGTFTCKKFIISFVISYLISIPPFPSVAVPILTIPDTVYIAPEKWVVQHIIRSSYFDLSIFGLGSFTIPGLKVVIIPEIPVVTSASEVSPSENGYELLRNYPNPFNPITTITYRLDEAGVVNLKVFDALGRTVQTLLEGFVEAGEHKIQFDGRNLSSGAYYYVLSGEKGQLARKMLLLK